MQFSHTQGKRHYLLPFVAKHEDQGDLRPGPAELPRPPLRRSLPPGPGPGDLDDDVGAGVQIHESRIQYQVISIHLSRVPAVELDRHVCADLVLALLTLG